MLATRSTKMQRPTSISESANQCEVDAKMLQSFKRKPFSRTLKSRPFLFPMPLLASASLNLFLVLLAMGIFLLPLHYQSDVSASPGLPFVSPAINGINARTSNTLPGTPGGQNNRCMSGWIWFNNKCWVATSSRRDWTHAVELCKRMYIDSTLPTIHSDEENEFLRNNIELRNSPIWLHARHNHQYNKTRWLDKTPTNYTRWDSGQPSDKTSMVCIKTEDNWYMRKTEPINGNTECVSFWEDGKWSTSVGCTVLLPVVCEKKLNSKLVDGNNSTKDGHYWSEVTSALASASCSLHESMSKFLLLAIGSIAVYKTRSTTLNG